MDERPPDEAPPTDAGDDGYTSDGPVGGHPSEPHHRNLQGGWARAAVFGVSDGLVSNTALVLGLAGAHAAAATVRLAGLAGLIGGAFSMAAGEYVSMRAQRELLERELEVERLALRHEPAAERRELAKLYESRGVEPDVAHELAGRMMADPEVALEIHAREELGVDPRELGNPMQTAVSSFITFALGAVLPLLPWLVTGGTGATMISVAVAAVVSLVVGGVLSIFTGRSWHWSSVRQLLISGAAAAVTYSIGVVIGA